MTESDYYYQKLQRYNADKDIIHQAEKNAMYEKEDFNLFSMLKPTLLQDGNQWCCLYGDDLQVGIAGFGDTPYLAVKDWNKQWNKKATTLNQLTTEAKP